MPVLKMTKNKTLAITKLGNTYQYENNAEILKIILPKTLNNNDLKDCYIYLCFINQQRLGDVSDITGYLTEHSNDGYVVEVPMYQIFTCEPGIIDMWIKILHSPTQMVATSNEVNYVIQKHSQIEGTIPEQEMSIIENLVMKIDAMTAKVEEVSDTVDDIITGDQQIAQGGISSDGMDVVEI